MERWQEEPTHEQPFNALASFTRDPSWSEYAKEEDTTSTRAENGSVDTAA
jgi:hypothetical protein